MILYTKEEQLDQFDALRHCQPNNGLAFARNQIHEMTIILKCERDKGAVLCQTNRVIDRSTAQADRPVGVAASKPVLLPTDHEGEGERRHSACFMRWMMFVHVCHPRVENSLTPSCPR